MKLMVYDKRYELYNNSYVEENYTIIKKIGEGGNGIVYLVMKNKDDNKGKKFIMKKIHYKGIEQFTEVAMFSHFKLRCNGLLTMDDFFFVQDQDEDRQIYYLYILIDYIEDVVDLEIFHRDIYIKKMSKNYLKQFYKIFLDISTCIKCLHDINIIHLDIKPANILVKYDDKNDYNTYMSYLIDYGLSCFLEIEKDSSDAEIENSCSFIKDSFKNIEYLFFAPEIYEIFNKIPVGTHSDIYSLGITMFIILFDNVRITSSDYNSVYKFLSKNAESDPDIKFLLRMIDRDHTIRPNIDDVISFIKAKLGE